MWSVGVATPRAPRAQRVRWGAKCFWLMLASFWRNRHVFYSHQAVWYLNSLTFSVCRAPCRQDMRQCQIVQQSNKRNGAFILSRNPRSWLPFDLFPLKYFWNIILTISSALKCPVLPSWTIVSIRNPVHGVNLHIDSRRHRGNSVAPVKTPPCPSSHLSTGHQMYRP